jgi:hypothetical protein
VLSFNSSITISFGLTIHTKNSELKTQNLKLRTSTSCLMNIEHLRRALKSEWLNYYRQNRHWIMRLGVWVNCQGQRRPSASFILGTLSTLEPQLIQLLPLVVDLNSNPDRIVIALGLNFNPEEELESPAKAELAAPPETKPKMLPSLTNQVVLAVDSTMGSTAVASRKEKQPSYVSSDGQSDVQLDQGQLNQSQFDQVQLKPTQPDQPTLNQVQLNQVQPDSPEAQDVQSPAVPSVEVAAQSTNQPFTNHLSHQRIPLDTAQLSAHELPDRGITRTGRNDRKRKKVPWD